MATRIGIELSPVACRVVELEGADLEPGRPLTTRIRSYAVLPPSGPKTATRFASLRRRSVAVVVWGVRSDHRQVVVSNGSYDKMLTEALASARAVGVDTRGTLADIAPASTAIKGANRQPVVLALANADEVSAAVRPLLDAGVRIRSLLTPADALLGLARSRQPFAVPGGIEAYVALDETVTCVALVRDGSLLSARELAWGYHDGASAPAASSPAALARRDDLAARLVNELADFLTAIGAQSNAVTQVSICGGLSELRTMTAPLMEKLDVEVETLDSLFGIDAERLPEPAEEFRERAAELRLAWAAAADWRGPINLLRHRHRRQRRTTLARAAVVAGVAAGLGAGWAIQQSQWWKSREPAPVARQIPPAPARSEPARPSAAPRQQPPAAAPRPAPAPVVTVSPPRTPSPPVAAAPRAPAPLVVTPVAPPLAARTPATTAPAAPPAAPRTPAAPVTAPVAATPVATPRVPSPATTPPRPAVPPRAAPQPPAIAPPTPAPAPATSPPPAVPSPAPRPPAAPVTPPVAPAVQKPAPRPPAAPVTPPVAPAVQKPGEPPPLPFDAVLGTILFSPDRKLAIINGRIVGVGDEVNGARIVDITPATVLLRDARGRLRVLTLGPIGQTPAIR